MPKPAELRPGQSNRWMSFLEGLGFDPQELANRLEEQSFLQLALGGDKYAAADPRSQAGVKEAAIPTRNVSGSALKFIVDRIKAMKSAGQWDMARPAPVQMRPASETERFVADRVREMKAKGEW